MLGGAFNQEKALVRGLLRDSKTLNFAKVRFELYPPDWCPARRDWRGWRGWAAGMTWRWGRGSLDSAQWGQLGHSRHIVQQLLSCSLGMCQFSGTYWKHICHFCLRFRN